MAVQMTPVPLTLEQVEAAIQRALGAMQAGRRAECLRILVAIFHVRLRHLCPADPDSTLPCQYGRAASPIQGSYLI